MFTRPCGSANLWGEGGAGRLSLGEPGLEPRLHRLAVGHPSQKAPGRSERIDGKETRITSVESLGAVIITRGQEGRPMSRAMVGIDVGKRQLDVSVDEGEVRRFPNTPAGVAKLVDWLQSPGEALAICEATGGYELLLVRGLGPGGTAGAHRPSQPGAGLRPGLRAPGQDRPIGRRGAVPLRQGLPTARPPLLQSQDRTRLQELLGANGTSWWPADPGEEPAVPGGQRWRSSIDTATHRVAGSGDPGIGA